MSPRRMVRSPLTARRRRGGRWKETGTEGNGESKEGGKRREGENEESNGRRGGRLATTGLNVTMRVPEGLSMVADSTLGPAGVWAAGIQVEAVANPKESSPWLPAPASTGLHADLSAGIRTREKHERTTNHVLRARGGAYTCSTARIIPLSCKISPFQYRRHTWLTPRCPRRPTGLSSSSNPLSAATVTNLTLER